MTQLDQFTIFANYCGTNRPYKAPRRKAALRDGAVRLFLCLSVCWFACHNYFLEDTSCLYITRFSSGRFYKAALHQKQQGLDRHTSVSPRAHYKVLSPGE